MGRVYKEEVKKKFEVMGLLTSGVITERQAGEQLNLSIRQVRRLKGRFIEGGKTIDS